jgi:Domain of unknown function (DUF1707)
MAMRYDVRTCMMQSDEIVPNVPGWPAPGQHGLGKHGHGQKYTYDLRIGDAERDVAMDQLREHFAAGRLTLDELTERIDGALAAKTQTQIDALMADLPRLSEALTPRRTEASSDTGRYVVSMLVLFALAAWLLMLAYMASRHGYGYTGPPPP